MNQERGKREKRKRVEKGVVGKRLDAKEGNAQGMQCQ